MEDNNRPAYEKRLGNIRVAVWQNVNDGKRWYNVSFTRRYRQDDEWREATTFNGLGDLAIVAQCLELAKNWIARQGEEP